MAKGTSIRLDDPTRERVEAMADEHGVDFSTAVRMALKRGLSAYEADRAPQPQQPRAKRRVLSRGVGF